jgi:predicted CXXCH cytochrome family protein
MGHVNRSIPTVAGVAAIALAGVMTTGQDAPPSGADQEKPTTETEVCATADCHADIVDRKVMHRPVADGECLACHEYDDPAEHTFVFVVEADELCWECHDTGFEEDVVHAPVDEGDCTACHDPHGSDQPAMLLKPLTRGLCLECHDDMPDWQKQWVHGPAAAQACTACHHPHESANEMLLAPPRTLCLDCHFADMPADDEEVHRHEPVVEGGCAECHNAHASDFRYQLRTALPELCWECHDEVKLALEEAAVVHGPLADDGGCASCHNPHYSTSPALLMEPQPRVCLQCHGGPVQTPAGRALPGFTELLKKNPDRHGPLRDGDCTACHQPHAGEYFRLLVEAYPAKFYVPFAIDRYELCFSCHDEGLAEDESGTDVTGFRAGDLNLHWVHVNRTKGRTCRACHEVHASKLPFHIREAVPFGSAGWTLKINYKWDEDGGSCAPDCHEPIRYRREAPEEEAPEGESAPTPPPDTGP